MFKRKWCAVLSIYGREPTLHHEQHLMDEDDNVNSGLQLKFDSWCRQQAYISELTL